MKGLYITVIAVIFLCMVLFPLLSMRETVVLKPPENIYDSSNLKNNGVEFRVKFDDGEIRLVSAYDYVVGVVGAEMSAENELEALKAQAVASYTFALRRKETRKNEDYDVTSSSLYDQAYYTDEILRERFSENYEKYITKIKAAVDEVYGQYIAYENEPIFAAYHSTSGGKTESAENVWGQAYPYLVPTESVGDMLSSEYLSTLTVSEADFKSAMDSLSVNLGDDAKDWIEEKNCSESGTVLTLKISGKEVKGTEIRKAFGLRSANFDVEYSEGSFKFTVRGYGHLVGMSQFGAKTMAEQGSLYNEILAWYYPNTTLVKQ